MALRLSGYEHSHQYGTRLRRLFQHQVANYYPRLRRAACRPNFAVGRKSEGPSLLRLAFASTFPGVMREHDRRS